MFGHSTCPHSAQMLPVFEVLERRYCFSAAVAVEGASFADPTPLEEELWVGGEHTSNFVWGVHEEIAGSGLRFDAVASAPTDQQFFSIGDLVFHNVGTVGGEAAGVNLLLTLKIDGKVQT